jgi:hypothetical protein
MCDRRSLAICERGLVLVTDPAHKQRFVIYRDYGSQPGRKDFTIQSLTNRGAPDATNDKILIFDNAAGTALRVNF